LYFAFSKFWQTSTFKFFRKYDSHVPELGTSFESSQEGGKLKGQVCQSQNTVEIKVDVKMHLENSPRIEVQGLFFIFKPLVLYSFWK